MHFTPTLPADPPGIGELRRRLGISQVEIADRLGVSQPCVAKIEHQEDMRLSTLRRYVAGLGGAMRLFVDIDGATHELRIGATNEKTSIHETGGLQCNSSNTLSSHA